MERSLEKTTNEEITVLKLKLEILEAQLKLALDRAETAENELNRIRSEKRNSEVKPSPPLLPPPPPPPLPKTLLYTNNSFRDTIKKTKIVNNNNQTVKTIQKQQVDSTGGYRMTFALIHIYSFTFVFL